METVTLKTGKKVPFTSKEGRLIHHKENNKLRNAATDTTVELKSTTTVTPKP